MAKSLTIASPCYNEEASLPDYFATVKAVKNKLAADGWSVQHLVINDGSSDDSLQILEAYAEKDDTLRIIDHPTNMGYGAAMKTAFSLIETDFLAFVDTDSNYDQKIILELVSEVTSDADILNVSILAPGGSLGFPWHRKLLSRSTTILYRLFFPILTGRTYTMTCGFRLYRRNILEKIMPISDGFYATAESMLRALMAGMSVVDIPATNEDRRHGVSKMRFVATAIGHIKLILRARFGLMKDGPSFVKHRSRFATNTN